MGEIVIRKARSEEAPVITRFLRNMVDAIASAGARTPARDDRKWLDIQSNIESAILHNERFYLLAECTGENKKPIGFIEASIFSTVTVFEPRKVLHIHSLYVVDTERRKGVATDLMKHMLLFGKEQDCTEAELDTLVANPARGLFEKLGFRVREYNMRKTL